MVSPEWSPRILSVLRIIAGLLFLEHGLIKLVGFPAPMPGMDHLPPLLLVAGIIELVCGTLIALGLFTRIASFLASGEMAVAYFMGHMSHGFWPALNQGEAAILFCFIFLYLVFAGPGEWSVDALRGGATKRI